MPPPAQTVPSAPRTSFSAPGARRALAGFFLSGLLLAFIGAVLPAWGYHLTSYYQTIGEYFLAASLGIVVSLWLGQLVLRVRGIRTVLTGACATGCAALAYLALVEPPAPSWARMLGIFLVGMAIGLLHSAIFLAITPMYRHDAAATANLGSALFGLGCVSASLLMYGTYYVYTVSSILLILATIPAVFAVFYYRARYAPPSAEAFRPVSEVLADLRSASAILFALLLFFQFGNEWGMAGWLPIYLVQRLGISPEKSLLLLGLYWTALLVGRIVVQGLLASVPHTKLLMGSVGAGLLGTLILSFTDNRFGAMTGILLIGCGFAPIYPLVTQKIGHRFPSYHPGFFNGIFGFAFIGGLLAPCTLGWFADAWDIRAVTVLPIFGTVMVLLLLLAIWVEGRFPVQRSVSEAEPAGPS